MANQKLCNFSQNYRWIAATAGPPPRVRDLVQRRRGQHDLLCGAAAGTVTVVGRADRPDFRFILNCRNRSPMSAASPMSTTRSAPSWARSNLSGAAPTPCGSSCRRPSARPAWRSGRFPAPPPREYRYCVEVRHRVFFDDPRSEQQLEAVLGEVGAEWATFDTTVLFESPPASDAEREAWRKKPRLPRRSRALTAHPVVRYIGRDDAARTVAGGSPGSTRWPAGCVRGVPRPSSSTRPTTSTRSSWPAGSTATCRPGCRARAAPGAGPRRADPVLNRALS